MNRNRGGRRYDREFKNDAVALVRGGRTITEVARDLGVSKWSLGHWVRRAEEGQMLSEPKTLALETPEQRELRRLRQELAYVSRQRDILSLNRSTYFLSVAPAKSLGIAWDFEWASGTMRGCGTPNFMSVYWA